MTDLREKVARAIHARRQTASGGGNYDGMVQIAKQCLLDEADAAIRVCWEEINKLIVPGELPGNGCDKSAERNGLVLAANALSPAIREDGK